MSGFVFDLGMNIENFTKSISEVEDELKRLKDSLKTATGQGIVETNVQIKQLEKSLVDLKKVGLDKLPGGITNASNALMSLGQVTRDLPFGFVAIQNNLPAVVDSFGQLTKQSGGLGPALKSIGASLIGPAGVSFAFGAVIAGVTALIQKYGSLSNAYSAIVSGNSKLIETQKEYNKAIASTSADVVVEEAKIKILVGTLNNLDAPQKQRIAAYNELKKISPDVVAGIKDENALTSESINIINKSAQARLQLIKLKIQEAGITAVLTKNAEELANANIALEDANNKVAIAQKNYDNQSKTRLKSGIGLVDNLKDELSILTNLKYERDKEKKIVDGLIATQDKYLKQLPNIVAETSAINLATKERNDNLKKENKLLKENEKESLKALRAKNLKELADFNKELSQPLTFEAAYVNMFPKLDEKLKSASKGLEAFRKKNVEVETDKKGPVFVPTQSFLDAQNKLKIFQDNLAAARNNLQNVFFDPLTDLFTNFFETGKLTFGDFAKVVIKTISQIVAKILATGVINLLANLIGVGGVSTGLGKGIGGVLKAAVGSVLGLNFGGGIAAPSFAGVGGGSLGMSGQVNLVLRGQDLVGSLNRTNTLINRVG